MQRCQKNPTNPGHKKYELNYSPETSIYLKWGKQRKIMGKPLEMQFCWVMKPGMAFCRWKPKSQKKVSKKKSHVHSFLLSHHRYLSPQTSVSKSKDFFSPQQPYPQMALILPLLFWESYWKREKKRSFTLPQSISRMKGASAFGRTQESIWHGS